MPRPQFTLRALLVVMLVVAAYFGGIATERHRAKRIKSTSKPLPIMAGSLKTGQRLSLQDLKRQERAMRGKSVAGEAEAKQLP